MQEQDIKQGQNACVFKKNMCDPDNNNNNNIKYRSKVDKQQTPRMTPTTPEEERIYKSTEYAISQKIQEQKKPPFYYFFSPLLEECAVRLEEVDIGECNVNNDATKPDIITYKMRDEGDMTWEDKILQIAKDAPKQVYRFLLDTLLYVIHAIDIMQSLGIVHNDLHMGNIMYNDTTQTPVIIDFGMSYEMQSTWQEYEGMYHGHFFDQTRSFIKMESSIMGVLFRNPKITTVELEAKVNELLDNKDYSMFQTMQDLGAITDEEKEAIRKAYMETYIHNKSREETLTACAKTVPSFDYFSVMTEMLILVNDKMKEAIEAKEKEEFSQWLKKYVYQIPSIMPVQEAKRELQTLFLQAQQPEEIDDVVMETAI